MKKELFYLLIIPLFMVVSIAVASLFLSIQRPIYRAQALVEYSLHSGGREGLSNVLHAATSAAVVVQACNFMDKSPDSVTSNLIRTSSRLAKTRLTKPSCLIYLVTEAHDPQLAADYVNALAKALCLKYSGSANDIGLLVRLVEPAYTPEFPVSPQWTKTLLLNAAGGFVGGLAFYLFGSALRRKSTHEKNLYGEKSVQLDP